LEVDGEELGLDLEDEGNDELLGNGGVSTLVELCV
jgi:hypothetical protein